MRIIFSLLLIVILTGCVPPASHRAQKPSTTTLLPPIEPDLKKYYDENIEGITCLAEYLSPQRYLIGVGYKPSNEGARIINIMENSPAKKAGLKIGDIITKINMKDIEYPFLIDAPVDLEIKRNNDIFTTRLVPSLMNSNNAIETKITIKERRGEKYIYEIIVTGIELNTVQFKTHYDRSKWIVSQWATGFWKFNNVSGCLKDKVIPDNLALQFIYSYRNFVTEQYRQGHDEFLDIFSKKKDIIDFADGNISVQDLLDKSAIFINGSREQLLMQ